MRDTLLASFLGFAPVTALALVLTGTEDAIPPWWSVAVFVPLTALGALVGGRGFAHLSASRRRYERALTAVLLLAVVAGLASVVMLEQPPTALRGRYRVGRMAQEHGDRLTAVDASFLAQEGPTSHMHVGAVMIFEGPAPSFDALADHVRARLHLVPRFRQKLAFPPLETGRPLWVDDPSFNLEYHVRDTALPAPGSEAQLRALAARVHSQALDRSKPLWELWLVHGLRAATASRSSPRRTTRWSTASRASTSRRCSSTSRASPRRSSTATARGRRSRRRAACRWPRAACAGCSASRSRRRRGRSARRRARAPRCTRRARRSRGSARSSGPG